MGGQSISFNYDYSGLNTLILTATIARLNIICNCHCRLFGSDWSQDRLQSVLQGILHVLQGIWQDRPRTTPPYLDYLDLITLEWDTDPINGL